MKDTFGEIMRSMVHHLKSIEHYIEWSKVIRGFHGQDKNKMNAAANKVRVAINEVAQVAHYKPLVDAIQTEVRDDERMCYVMTLVEQLYDLDTETLGDVTDLIDDFLNKKYYDTERRCNTARDDERQRDYQPVQPETFEPCLG